MKRYLIYLLLIAFFVINLLGLTSFPFAHSDEAWQAGYSRFSAAEGLSATEPFFDLFPRTVHTLRSIFAALQSPFFTVFGFSLFSARLLSLLFSTLSLWLLWRLLEEYSPLQQLFAWLFLASSIHFIYTARLARQEPIILFVLLTTLYLLRSKKKKATLLAAVLTGLTFGVHLNGLLILLPFSLLQLYYYIKKEIPLSQLLLYSGIAGGLAGIFLFSSLYLNPDFVQQYLAYGETQGAIASEIGRMEGAVLFYRKLFAQVGGTYQLMDIRLELILLGLAFAISLFLLLRNKLPRRGRELLLLLFAMQAVQVLINRNNQTSIIFFLLIGTLLLFTLLPLLPKRAGILLLLVLVLLGSAKTHRELSVRHQSYEHFIAELAQAAPEGKVLANLNAYFGFEGRLYDYRNLAYLGETSIHEYIEERGIRYIVYYEEMDYIYRNLETWWILYGDLPYYEELQSYLSGLEIVYEAAAPTYAMRIARYVDTYPWMVTVYKVP